MDLPDLRAAAENLKPGTIDDLVAIAISLGYTATPRLVHDWVAKGLIDRPTRQRVGRTGSQKALHSPMQCILFLDLLEMRNSGGSLQDLADWVIALWVMTDDWVPTRQALRALKTWYGDPRSSKAEAHRISIEQTSPMTDDPRLGTARDRRAFLHAVRDVFYTGRIDEGLLRETAKPIFEPQEHYLWVVQDRDLTAPADIDAFIIFLKMIISAGRSVTEGAVTEELLNRARTLMRQHSDSGRGRVSMADLVAILGLFALEHDLADAQITVCVSTADHNLLVDLDEIDSLDTPG